jgi:hypothetical protein
MMRFGGVLLCLMLATACTSQSDEWADAWLAAKKERAAQKLLQREYLKTCLDNEETDLNRCGSAENDPYSK